MQQLLSRRWRLMLAITVAIPIVVLALSLRQPAKYEASAKILLARQSLANAVTGTQDPNFNADEDRLVRTQATLARNPSLGARALRAAGLPPEEPDDFAKRATVTEQPLADVLVFSVVDEDARVAERLATTWAREYSEYRRELDTAAIDQALTGVESRLRELVRNGRGASELATSLEDNVQELRTLATLQTSNARLVQEAIDAEQVSPRPLRNAAFGLVAALFIAMLLAYAREMLDTRIRSQEEIGQELDLPLLGRLPPPPRERGGVESLVMIEDPRSHLAEAVRTLRTNVEILMMDGALRSLMVSSGVEQEGKSTTVANLALTLARTGRHVVLLDLDLRKPVLHRKFRLESSVGLMDVLLDKATLDDAIADIDIGSSETESGISRGRLEVLPAGFVPDAPSELFSSMRFREVLRDLSYRGDILLVDSAPLLPVSDSIALSAHIDAVLLLVRVPGLRRRVLRETARVLDRCAGRKIGFATTGDLYAGDLYGYDAAYGDRPAAPEDQDRTAADVRTEHRAEVR
jgi:succinoglycan biosynthesis transport protein ExoP